MTAPASNQWIQCIAVQIKERGANQPDELTFHSSYGQAPIVLKQKPPKRPMPAGEMPSLPAGVKRTCEDRVLVYNIQENGDREMAGMEIAACRAWLFWRWSGNQDVLRPKVEG
jgi:hypothetical protein